MLEVNGTNANLLVGFGFVACKAMLFVSGLVKQISRARDCKWSYLSPFIDGGDDPEFTLKLCIQYELQMSSSI